MAQSGIQLSWQNIIMTAGLGVVLIGGFWSLAYIPIQRNIDKLDHDITELRESHARIVNKDDERFLTQKEHNEFKSNVRDADARQMNDIKDLRSHVEILRTEAATRQDVQNALNTTRVEFLAEIKRLDQNNIDNMKRLEFSAWKTERDKVISIMQERQNRFSEALDSLYAKITAQPPSYHQPQ